MLKETKHDYQYCLVGNFYDNKCTGTYESWEDFKNTHAGFVTNVSYNDTYNFVFRYDIHKQVNPISLLEDGKYRLELCIMLQRKGIYTHLYIRNIDQNTLNTEVKEWLKGRSKYITHLWKEVL